MNKKEIVNRIIESLWKKHPKNAIEAHFRAEEITRLTKLKDKK
jgi:hypothetical protein